MPLAWAGPALVRSAAARGPHAKTPRAPRPPGYQTGSGDVRPAVGGLPGRQPWAGAGGVPRVRRSRRTGRPATGRGRIRPARPVDDAAGGFTGPGPVMGTARDCSGAGQEAGGCPFRPVVCSATLTVSVPGLISVIEGERAGFARV